MRKIAKEIKGTSEVEKFLSDKKTIQKAVESFRVSDEHKEYLKSFR